MLFRFVFIRWTFPLIVRIRYSQDDARERQQFIESLNVDWEMVWSWPQYSNHQVDEAEKISLADQLRTSTQKSIESESFLKVGGETSSYFVPHCLRFL